MHTVTSTVFKSYRVHSSWTCLHPGVCLLGYSGYRYVAKKVSYQQRKRKRERERERERETEIEVLPEERERRKVLCVFGQSAKALNLL
jgi:hypothetical protein